MKIKTEGDAGRSLRVGKLVLGVDAESHEMVRRSLLVCFSGKIGSGKTSISRAVACRLGCRRTSFGGYLRDEVALRGGDPDCRESLQDLGQYQIEQDAESFCRDVLATGDFIAGEDFVLDGIRHIEVLAHLGRIAVPSELRLIFINADAGLRSSRVGKRSDRARADFDRATGHVVETDMEDELPMEAHAIVDGSLPEQDVIGECIELIDGWRWDSSDVPSLSEVLGTAGRMGRK